MRYLHSTAACSPLSACTQEGDHLLDTIILAQSLSPATERSKALQAYKDAFSPGSSQIVVEPADELWHTTQVEVVRMLYSRRNISAAKTSLPAIHHD